MNPNTNWWETFKNDLGFIIGLIGILVAAIRPVLDWLSNRKSDQAKADKNEAQALEARAKSDLTMAEASEKLANTATAIVTKLEARLAAADALVEDYKAKCDEMSQRVDDLMRESADMQAVLAQLRIDIEKYRNQAVESQFQCKQVTYRIHEALEIIRDTKKNYPWVAQNIHPPSNADEDQWILSTAPLLRDYQGKGTDANVIE